MSEVEAHIRAVEERLGVAGDELDLRDWVDARIRIAGLRLKIEQHDLLAGMVAELKPMLARSLGAGDAPPPPESPNLKRAGELVRRMGDEMESVEENVAAIAEALDQAEARGHDLAKFPGLVLG